jgi:hypothetical protein
MSPPRAAALVFLCAVALAGDGEAARRRFFRDFTENAPAEVRLAAIAELAASDSPAAARTLLETWEQLEARGARARGNLVKALARIRALEVESRSDRGELQRARRDELSISAELRRIEAEQAAILDGIGRLRAPEAVRWLVDEGLARATSPLLLQTIALHLAEADETGVPALVVSLEAARRPEQIVPLLHALARKGADAWASAVPTVLRQLLHEDWAVRAAAAHALAAIARPECVEPVIRALGKEAEGSRGLQEMTRALQVLTGQKFGPFPDVWVRWYADRRADILAGRIPLGRGTPTDEASAGGRFYGIPQDALRIVYVLDVSGSMEVSMTDPRWDGNVPLPPRKGEPSRLEAAKKELLRAVKSLRSGTRFAVLLYSDHVRPLHDELVPAGPDAYAKLEAELAGTVPGGSTNIYAAMDAAMRLAGVHPDMPSKEQRADAIFLVSDGSPTTSDGKTEDPARTLHAVRNWNALRRVVIHTIGIGREHARGFMRSLAEQNGGRYFPVLQ